MVTDQYKQKTLNRNVGHLKAAIRTLGSSISPRFYIFTISVDVERRRAWNFGPKRTVLGPTTPWRTNFHQKYLIQLALSRAITVSLLLLPHLFRVLDLVRILAIHSGYSTKYSKDTSDRAAQLQCLNNQMRRWRFKWRNKRWNTEWIYSISALDKFHHHLHGKWHVSLPASDYDSFALCIELSIFNYLQDGI